MDMKIIYREIFLYIFSVDIHRDEDTYREIYIFIYILLIFIDTKTHIEIYILYIFCGYSYL